MLSIVNNAEDVRKYQQDLEDLLASQLEESEDEYKIGHQGHSWNTTVQYGNSIWYHSYEETEETDTTPRFWNGFGLSAELDKNKSNNIVVEINIPTDYIRYRKNIRRVAGLFAIDEELDDVILMHRGKINGIRQDTFMSYFQKKQHTIFDYDGKEKQALIVAHLKSDNFIEDLSSFVKKVAEIKKSKAEEKKRINLNL